jgi:hypothetical protein
MSEEDVNVTYNSHMDTRQPCQGKDPIGLASRRRAVRYKEVTNRKPQVGSGCRRINNDEKLYKPHTQMNLVVRVRES